MQRCHVCPCLSCGFISSSHVFQLTLCSRANIVIGVVYLLSACAYNVIYVSVTILLLYLSLVFCTRTGSWLNVCFSQRSEIPVFSLYLQLSASLGVGDLLGSIIYCTYKWKHFIHFQWSFQIFFKKKFCICLLFEPQVYHC